MVGGWCRREAVLLACFGAVRAQLDIDYELQRTRIYGYPEESADEAESAYFERERAKPPLQDVLLVRSVSIKSLLETYPNYSMDIRYFLDCVDELVG